MLRRRRSLPTGLACAVTCLLAVAAHAGGPRKPAAPAAAPPAPLPVTTRGSTEPDVAALPADPPLALPAGEPTYRLLTTIECQCRAVHHSSVGNLLARERARLSEASKCGPAPVLQFLLPRQTDQSATELKLAILYYSELEARNRSVGSALDLYFKLAELEAKADLLDLAVTDLEDAIRRSRDLMQQGFKVPIELTTLQRQEIDARADRVKLAAGIIDLNGRLKGMIGQDDLPCDDRLWPAGEFTVDFTPIDPDAAVHTGLTHRAELNLLRTVFRDLDRKTLPVIRDFLKGLNALLGEQPRHSTHLGRAYDALVDKITAFAAERALRSAQVQQLLAERERAVADEVRRALAELHTKGHLVALGKQRVLTMGVRQRETEEKMRSGTGSFLEVVNAKLEAYKARAQLAEDVMGWHAARARLKQAQGVLVLECCGPKSE